MIFFIKICLRSVEKPITNKDADFEASNQNLVGSKNEKRSTNHTQVT
jgi:hypothetical protein